MSEFRYDGRRGQYAGGVARPAGVAIDEGLRSYMLGVYNYMALGVAGTGLVALALATNPALMQAIAMGPMKWVLFAVVLGLGFFAPRVIFTAPKIAGHAMYWLYAVAWGALIAPMLYAFASAGLASEIYKAFFITTIAFGGTSLYGYTTKRDLSPMATFMMIAGIGLLAAIILNAIFFQSTLMSLVTSSLVVVLFAGVTAYETQMIKSIYVEGAGEANARASIFGAFALYGSFITLFIHILNILGIMRSE